VSDFIFLVLAYEGGWAAMAAPSSS